MYIHVYMNIHVLVLNLNPPSELKWLKKDIITEVKHILDYNKEKKI